MKKISFITNGTIDSTKMEVDESATDIEILGMLEIIKDLNAQLKQMVYQKGYKIIKEEKDATSKEVQSA